MMEKGGKKVGHWFGSIHGMWIGWRQIWMWPCSPL